jgi:hypothetical protein
VTDAPDVDGVVDHRRRSAPERLACRPAPVLLDARTLAPTQAPVAEALGLRASSATHISRLPTTPSESDSTSTRRLSGE